MNIFLWILQGLLALHTLIGAGWKFTNSEQAVPGLEAIPHSVWMALIVFEIICSFCLIFPAVKKSAARFVPLAAVGIAAEMLLFCVVNIVSGQVNYGHLVYWLVVAAVCAFVAYGRLKIKPL